jgi:hypothetical protein
LAGIADEAPSAIIPGRSTAPGARMLDAGGAAGEQNFRREYSSPHVCLAFITVDFHLGMKAAILPRHGMQRKR